MRGTLHNMRIVMAVALSATLPCIATAMHPQPPAWMLSSFSSTSGDGGGSCTGPLQCNAKNCYNCACKDSKCACSGGFSGPHCENIFCVNRTSGCSGHGDCVQTLQNITCECDKYYSGSHCEVAECQLDCKHGGTPNKDCTQCEGCKGAWSGKLCNVWNEKVPVHQLMSKLYEISNASQKMLKAQQKFNPICKQGHECVGWGIDGVSGSPTPFPVVHLSYDPTRSDKKFNRMSEPIEVVANHVVNPVWASVDGANGFPRMEDFEQHVNTVYKGASPMPRGTSGIYSRDFNAVFDEFYQKSDDRALSVVRASKSYISMSLPVDPVTKTRKYYFDRHANDFINSLPPTYSTEEDKQQFRHFIESYGTSFAVSATLGGRVEQYSSFKSWMTDDRFGGFTPTTLAENAKIDFYKTTGLPGSGAGTHDKGYDHSTVVLEALNCQGGDPSINCESNFKKWSSTIGQSLVLLDYELAPISDLVADPDIKRSLEAAVNEYVEEQNKKWENTNKCPKNCGSDGAGTCVPGKQTSCNCKYNGIIGRMCSKCAPVNVRGTFTDIFGKEYSSTKSVGCTEKPTPIWQGDAKCSNYEFLQHEICSVSASADCARASNGNLIARVVQSPCYQKDVESYPERRLLRRRKRRLHAKDACLFGFDEQTERKGAVSSESSTAIAQQDKKSKEGFCLVAEKKEKKSKLVECRVQAKCEFV